MDNIYKECFCILLIKYLVFEEYIEKPEAFKRHLSKDKMLLIWKDRKHQQQ